MEEKVLKTIKKYELIKSGDNIVLGISGGPDSICMLYILNSLKKDLNFNIYVAHINHMLRENAKLDEEYVKNTCEKLNIHVYIKLKLIPEFCTFKYFVFKQRINFYCIFTDRDLSSISVEKIC